MCGNRLNRWKTMPIRDRCRAMSLSLPHVQLALALLDADQLAADPDPAAGQGLHLVDQTQEGGLARPAGPEQTHHLSGSTVRSMPFSTSLLPKDLVTLTARTRGSESVPWRSLCTSGRQTLGRLVLVRTHLDAEAAAEPLLEVGLADHQDAGGDQVVQRRRDQDREDLERAGADGLQLEEELGA